MTQRVSGIRLIAACLAFVLLAGCVTSQRIQFASAADTTWGPEPTPIPGLFFKPEGGGPFPAIVLLYTDGGMQPHVSQDWPQFLAENGFAVLTVDTYTPRNLNAPGLPAIKHMLQAKDAFGALDYLASRADIDPARIGVMGFSSGAIAIGELIMQAKPRNSGGRRFAAGVSVYGRCNNLSAADRSYMPLLLIVAENDKLLKPSCLRAIESGGFDGALLKGAYHGFDQNIMREFDAYGNRMVSSSAATKEAHALTLAFFNKHLKRNTS